MTATLESVSLTAEVSAAHTDPEPGLENDSPTPAPSSHANGSRAAQPSMDPLSGLSNLQRALILYIQQRREETLMEGEEWIGLPMFELAGFLIRHEKTRNQSELRLVTPLH